MPSEVCLGLVAVLHAVLVAVADWRSAAICLAISAVFAVVAFSFALISTRTLKAPARKVALPRLVSAR